MVWCARRVATAGAIAALALGGACAFDPVRIPPLDGDASLPVPPEAGREDFGVGPGGPGPFDAGFGPDVSTPFDTGGGNVVSQCGNGIREGVETCDDRNVADGDGCTAQCRVQAGWVCARDERSRCFRQSEVTYVNARRAGCPNVAGNGTGDLPYCSIQEALDSADVRTVLVAPGIYAESLSVEVDARVELVADGTVQVDGQTDLALDVQAGAQVVVVGFQLSGGSQGVVRVQEFGTRVDLLECEVGPSAGVGVWLSDDAVLVMQRSRVADNEAGGLVLNSAAGYDIKNVVVASNGTPTAVFGGVVILQRNSGSAFVNNTVVDNMSSDLPAGVVCMVAGTSMVNSIVWDNRQATGPSTVSSRCVTEHCVLGPGGSVSGTNINADPHFVGSDPWYHIHSDSPCRDAADPQGTIPRGPAPPWDVDGEGRPVGPRVDIGADEFQ